MSKIKNAGLDQYGTEPFEQQQIGTAGVEGVNEPATGDKLQCFQTLNSLPPPLRDSTLALTQFGSSLKVICSV